MTLQRGSALLLFASLAGAALSYVFWLATGWALPPAEYGVLGAYVAALGLMTIFLGAGYFAAVTRAMKEGPEARATTYATSLAVNVAIAAALAAGFWLLGRGSPLARGVDFGLLAALMAGILLTAAVTLIERAALQGLLRFGAYTATALVESTLRLALGLTLALAGQGAAGVLGAFLVANLASLLVGAWLLRKDRLLRARPSWGDPELHAYAIPMFVGVLGIQALLNLDVVGLKLFAASDEADALVGLYQAATLPARIPLFAASAMAAALFPFVSRAQDDAGARGTTLTATWFFVLAGAPFGLACLLAPAPLLDAMFPETYLPGAAALRWLGPAMVLLGASTLLATYDQAAGKARRAAGIFGLVALLEVALLWRVVPRWGAEGAALVTLAVAAVAAAGLALDLRARTASRRAWPLAGAALALAVFGVVFWALPKHGAAQLALALVVAGAAYVVALGALRVVTPADLDRGLGDLVPHENPVRRGARALLARLNRAARR